MAGRRQYVRTDFTPLKTGGHCSQVDMIAAERTYDGELLEFILAWDKAERQAGRHLRKSEVYQVILGIGYIKSSSS